MKIIKPGKQQDVVTPSPGAEDVVPFVIAYDLLEEMESRLTDEEAVAVALALRTLTTQTTHLNRRSPWRIDARQESLNQTVLG